MKETKNINWNEVEEKIAVICYKFSNLAPWHDDLAQELRIHAYYVSDNYYDLYRKAIDFWRKIQTKHNPECPYFDLELLASSHDVPEEEALDQAEEIVRLIREELTGEYNNKWELKRMELALELLDIILEDIEPKKTPTSTKDNSRLSRYINHRLNLSWVEEVTGHKYKQIVQSMKLLEDIVRGLHAMNKIEIPLQYFEGYYDK